jgi:ribose transport system permease protein
MSDVRPGLKADQEPALAPGGSTPGPDKAQRRARRSIGEIGGEYGVVVFLVAMVIAFAAADPGKFATGDNIRLLLADQGIPGILALAVVLPLAAGEFDLSVAANLGFCAVLTAKLASQGVPTGAVIVIALAVGLAVGVVNSVLVVGIGVNAFIATLGVSTVLAGGNLLITNGSVLFQQISPSLTDIATTEAGGLQLVFYYFVGAAIILWYVIEHTPYGRYLRATGLGRAAARLCGIRTGRYTTSAFLLAGLLAGLCGILQTARYGSASADVGPSFLLPAYAAAFLGATTIRRGRFNVWGTVIGTLLLGVGINGLTLLGAPTWVSQVFDGGALIVAVSVAAIVSRMPRRRLANLVA